MKRIKALEKKIFEYIYAARVNEKRFEIYASKPVYILMHFKFKSSMLEYKNRNRDIFTSELIDSLNEYSQKFFLRGIEIKFVDYIHKYKVWLVNENLESLVSFSV